jgi:protein involved in polysaccharide export with SLBB domain
MSTTSLELGEIVGVEVRDPGVTKYSHDYPVDASRLLRIPLLQPILAEGKALTPELRDEIHNRFVSDNVLSNPTINLTLRAARVDFQREIQPGDTLFIRILEIDGSANPASGSYQVDGSTSISFPFLGGVLLSGHRPFEAEHQIERGLVDGGFLSNPIVNVTLVQLA